MGPSSAIEFPSKGLAWHLYKYCSCFPESSKSATMPPRSTSARDRFSRHVQIHFECETGRCHTDHVSHAALQSLPWTGSASWGKQQIWWLHEPLLSGFGDCCPRSEWELFARVTIRHSCPHGHTSAHCVPSSCQSQYPACHNNLYASLLAWPPNSSSTEGLNTCMLISIKV